jgi:hypothetical protein
LIHLKASLNLNESKNFATKALNPYKIFRIKFEKFENDTDYFTNNQYLFKIKKPTDGRRPGWL